MAKPLTKTEQWQFELTASGARAPRNQRRAIRNRDIPETRAEVLRRRRENFARWRQQKAQAWLKKLPAWLAARAYEDCHDGWLGKAPIRAGTCQYARGLAQLAYDWAIWPPRSRKRAPGEGTSRPAHVATYTTGSGWYCTTQRYANYLCVLSPKEDRIAIQVAAHQPVELHTVWRGRFLFRGRVCRLSQRSARPYAPDARDTARNLRRHGLDARVVRQTSEQIASASGESLREGGKVCCVVADGLGGWYHAAPGQTSASVRVAMQKRKIAQRAEYLDALLASRPVWVQIADSLAAGNCVAGTQHFAEQLQAKIEATGEVGAVLAEKILAFRDDLFTRAACRVAALRVSR